MPRTRVHVGELISLVGALVLLIVMFAFAWYGVAGVPDPSAARPARTSTQDAWNALTAIRWVLLATIVAVLGSVAVHAGQRRHGARTQTGRLVGLLGSVSALLLVWRVLIALPGSGRIVDQKLGAVLGLAATLAIAWGGVEAMREERARALPADRPAHRARPGRRARPGHRARPGRRGGPPAPGPDAAPAGPGEDAPTPGAA